MKATDEQIMECIERYISENGYSPTIREVGAALGIDSAGSMLYRMRRLRDKGLVKFEDKKPRTLKVVQ